MFICTPQEQWLKLNGHLSSIVEVWRQIQRVYKRFALLKFVSRCLHMCMDTNQQII